MSHNRCRYVIYMRTSSAPTDYLYTIQSGELICCLCIDVSVQRAVPTGRDKTASARNWTDIQPIRGKRWDVGSATTTPEPPKALPTRGRWLRLDGLALSPANLVVNGFDSRAIREVNTFTKCNIFPAVPGYLFLSAPLWTSLSRNNNLYLISNALQGDDTMWSDHNDFFPPKVKDDK